VTIEQSYQNQITDEFIDPIVMVDAVDQPVATIQEDDVVIFNFRTDRGRELTEAFSQHDFHEQNMHKPTCTILFLTITTRPTKR
jgi:2,3-bisphosphoglycerate-independent phosphoglycerate mutase